ncbi:hypothetical protein P22_1139 [Propionispora sp. 2/2-37]|nr:hypothetical protein [Propionispora sp. 2/2-37]CUH95070.1 hypothetical protein P22_1139 [Propionispora sp. 2/2-37]
MRFVSGYMLHEAKSPVCAVKLVIQGIRMSFFKQTTHTGNKYRILLAINK